MSSSIQPHALDLAEQAEAPAAPPAGKIRLFADGDGKLQSVNSANEVAPVHSGITVPSPSTELYYGEDIPVNGSAEVEVDMTNFGATPDHQLAVVLCNLEEYDSGEPYYFSIDPNSGFGKPLYNINVPGSDETFAVVMIPIGPKENGEQSFYFSMMGGTNSMATVTLSLIALL